MKEPIFTELPVLFTKKEGEKSTTVKGMIYLNLANVDCFYTDANGMTTVQLTNGLQWQVQLPIDKFRRHLPDGVIYKRLIKTI